MAKEFLRYLQDLSVCAHKQNINVIFTTHHRSSYLFNKLLKHSLCSVKHC